MTPRARWVDLLLAAGVVFLLDQFSKYWLIEIYGIAARAPVHLCEYFALVMAWNKGVSFSMFSSHAGFMPYVLIALAVGISGVLARLCLKSADRLERVAYALIIGGALGNALDRVRFGAVADFFYAHIGNLGWPAFNVADSAICIGVWMLLLRMIKKPATP